MVSPIAREVSPTRGTGSRRGRRLVLCAVLPGLLFATTFSARAEDRPSPRLEQEQRLNSLRRKAIEAGCDWIATRQNQDGSFGDNKACVAFTALSTLALMSAGSGVARGPHGESVRKGIDFLVKLVEKPPRTDAVLPKGYFHTPQDNNSKMHGQGYATLALASALSSADTEFGRRIRDVLRLAVACAEDSQTGTGGWGYDPSSGVEHEGSVTVTVAQGLRAARDAGIRVNVEVVRKGLRYLAMSQKRLGKGNDEDGSFKYSLAQERSTYALTAAAVSSFYLFGEYGGDEESTKRIEDAIAYLRRKLRAQMKSQEWFFYGHFYAAWAAWQHDGQKPLPEEGQRWGGEPLDSDIERTAQFWGPWHAKVYPFLLRMQRADGHWMDEYDKFAFGDLLPTAFAVLTLAIPDEALPIFQR